MLHAVEHFRHGGIGDVADFIFGVYEVVAAVHVAVVLEGDGSAAYFGVDADGRRVVHGDGEHVVEIADVDFADVFASEPFVVDTGEEGSVGLGGYASVGDGSVVFSFDNGDELEKGGADALKEGVDFFGVACVCAVDAGEGVVVDAVFLKEVETDHDAVEAALAAFIEAIFVVDFAGAVDAEADEEAVLFEEGAPFVVELGSVGLEGVTDTHVWWRVFLLEGDGFPEKIDAHKGGLAALPREVYFFTTGWVAFDVLTCELFEHFVGHSE